MPWIEKRSGLQLADSQRAAIRLALTAKALVITGGPGVGKTTIVNSILKLQRNLVYTGVTRGKRLVVLVGQKKAIAIAVRNSSGRRRWSKLDEWLRLGASQRTAERLARSMEKKANGRNRSERHDQRAMERRP